MDILAIDPGCTESAWLSYGDGIGKFAKQPNETVLEMLRDRGPQFQHQHLAIEMVASYGMAVGKTVFETVFWIGRFVEAWNGPYTLVYRKDVKLHLCGSVRAKDANIRAALIDMFGGSRDVSIGTKKRPGPLYGITADVWAALAVATYYKDRKQTP